MSSDDDSKSTNRNESTDLRPAAAEGGGPTSWLYALNSFLERGFTEADRATGC